MKQIGFNWRCFSWSPAIVIPIVIPAVFFYFMHSSSCFFIHKICGGPCFLDQCEKQAATLQTQVSGGNENASPTSKGENSTEKSKFVPPVPLHVYISNVCLVLFFCIWQYNLGLV